MLAQCARKCACPLEHLSSTIDPFATDVMKKRTLRQWKQRLPRVIRMNCQATNTELDVLPALDLPKCLVVACVVVRIDIILADTRCKGCRQES